MGNRSRRVGVRRKRSEPPVSSVEPPTVMWPDEGSGFEASIYSPAGQAQQEARMIENLQEDAPGIRRAIRASWGAKIIVGGVAVMAAIGALDALVHHL